MQISYLAFLDYAYAPAIVLGYFLALVFGLCTRQQAITMRPKKRSLSTLFMFVIGLSYALEALFIVYQRQPDERRPALQHTIFRIATVAPIWMILAVYLYMTECLRWNPYVGVFILGFLFESIATALSFATRRYSDTVSLCLSVVRSMAALALSIIGTIFMASYTAERYSDEEAQPLLEHSNADTPRRRLTQPSNWIEYLQSFAIFMPHLLPWHDPKILVCLALRLVVALLNRALNVAIPWQLGTAIDKLISGPGTLPWKEIVFWTTGLLLDSSLGFNALDRLASNYIQNSSYKQVSKLAMGHIMKLSFEFHSSKNTGEILKAIDQAGSLNSLVELVIFQILPIVFDSIIAMVYVTHLFDIRLTLAIFSISTT
ncbi:ABC transporter [Paraphaeosphaeria minitans]|uniref:ABC transporter n=1 Tax=Paraphaeosphaeria minitans TaxID=565426 RepID=A0A9P6GDQ2_9PLEO|nr:ABC transporter [Paraphaeosphaeria minitans]